jgi:hypothetical protein
MQSSLIFQICQNETSRPVIIHQPGGCLVFAEFVQHSTALANPSFIAWRFSGRP